MNLGNHTFSHTVSDDLTAEQFERGIVAGENLVRRRARQSGQHPALFSFPGKSHWDTKEKHDAIAAFLKQRGYRVAVCTIDNEDYAF